MRLVRSLRLAFVVLVFALAGCTSSVTVAVGDETWTTDCADVSPSDCEGIARMFLNNLARNGGWVYEESGGQIDVTRAFLCPDIPAWGVPGACWRVSAPTRSARTCMLMARRTAPEQGYAFGWIGGEDLTGLLGAPKPGTTPC
jgi:hypothetical protein